MTHAEAQRAASPQGWLQATVHFDPQTGDWHADGQDGPRILRELGFMRDLIHETLLWANSVRRPSEAIDADAGLASQIRRYFGRNDDLTAVSGDASHDPE